MKYYIDKRIMEVVNENDFDTTYLAPEVFYEFDYETNDNVKEVWCIGNGQYIDFVYERGEIGCLSLNLIRQAHFSEYDVTPIYLKKYSIPKDLYLEVLLESGYEEGF